MVAREDDNKMINTVKNLKTGEKLVYVGNSPREAVICAYAQERKDNNTWDYNRYNHLVLVGTYTCLCGDWSVFHSGQFAGTAW